MNLKQYYDKNTDEIFNSVDNPHRRYWKVQDLNGRFRQNEKKINSVKRLREFIGDQPSKLYVSVSEWAQPQRVFGIKPKQAQWVVDDCLFYKSDLLFDFDHDDLNMAARDAELILNFMEHEPEYELINKRYSGNRGYHLLYKDKNPIKDKSPYKRLVRTKERRLELVNRLPALETIDDIHKMVIADQFRVHAAIGSVKAKTGHKVQKIDTLLQLFMPNRVVRPIRSMIVDELSILTSKSGKGGSTLTSFPYTYHFIDNAVHGTKGQFITVLKYPKGKKVNIHLIQEKYNLSHFFKFRYKSVDMYINFKLVDKRRLEKIMKFARPMNLNSFMYYGHTWIPLTDAVDKEGKVIWSKPELVRIIESIRGIKDTHSRPHAAMLGLTFQAMAGAHENRLCKAEITRVEK